MQRFATMQGNAISNVKEGYGLLYYLSDPRTGDIRYIGQTTGSQKKRLKEHLSRARSGRINSHKDNWLRELLSQALRPDFRILCYVRINHLNDAERQAIAYAKKAGLPLTNTADGGNFGFHGEDHPAAKLSDAEVVCIRMEYANDDAVTTFDLAEKYKVNSSSIGQIVRGDRRVDAGGPICPNNLHRKTGGGFVGKEGEKHPDAKLYPLDIFSIRERASQGESYSKIALDFPVQDATIGKIVRGSRWKHIGGPISQKACSIKLVPRDVIAIRNRAQQGESARKIAKDYPVCNETISDIVSRRSWKHIGGPIKVRDY